VGNFFERCLPRQFVNVVAPVHEPAFFTEDVAQCRGRRHDAFESFRLGKRNLGGCGRRAHTERSFRVGREAVMPAGAAQLGLCSTALAALWVQLIAEIRDTAGKKLP